MKKWYQFLLLVPVLALLYLLPMLTAYRYQKAPISYSMEENRNLSVMPVLEKNALWSGEYFSDVESFFSDHVYGRNSLLRLNTRLQLLRRSPSVSNVLLTKQTLLPEFSIDIAYLKPDQAAANEMAERLAAIHRQVESYGGVFLYMSVPTMYSARLENYPSYAVSPETMTVEREAALTAQLSRLGVPYLAMRERYAAYGNMTDLYYKVDHHYSIRGAYACYLELCSYLEQKGVSVPVLTQEEISFEALPNPFQGTYSRKLYGLSPVTEALEVYRTERSVPYSRWDNGERTDAPVQNIPDNSWQNVYYGCFMGGDQAETIVQTNRPELPSILIVGDSFTNAVESLAYLSFDEMRSLDYRHYKGMSLPDYIAEYQPDVVLILRDDSVALTLEGNGNLVG